MADTGLYTLDNQHVDWAELCNRGEVVVKNGEIKFIDKDLKGTLIIPSTFTFSQNISKPSWGFFQVFYDFEKEVNPVW